jgi:hypothetical protein
MTTLIEAILAINPSAKVGLADEDINQITWREGTPVISDEDILAKQAELQAEYDAKQYQRDRQYKYPSWQDQLDMQYHDKVDGTTTWKDAIQAVKDANPKP